MFIWFVSFDYINNLTSIKCTSPFQINFNNDNLLLKNNLKYSSLGYYLGNTFDLNGVDFAFTLVLNIQVTIR